MYHTLTEGLLDSNIVEIHADTIFMEGFKNYIYSTLNRNFVEVIKHTIGKGIFFRVFLYARVDRIEQYGTIKRRCVIYPNFHHLTIIATIGTGSSEHPEVNLIHIALRDMYRFWSNHIMAVVRIRRFQRVTTTGIYWIRRSCSIYRHTRQNRLPAERNCRTCIKVFYIRQIKVCAAIGSSINRQTPLTWIACCANISYSETIFRLNI